MFRSRNKLVMHNRDLSKEISADFGFVEHYMPIGYNKFNSKIIIIPESSLFHFLFTKLTN